MQCPRCDHDFWDGEPVFQTTDLRGRELVCARCIKHKPLNISNYCESLPCHRCGRPVFYWKYTVYGMKYTPPKHIGCSSTCLNALWCAEARRKRKLFNPTPTKTCTCGKVFVPKRSDAMHCSAACKQRAYRNRNRGIENPDLPGYQKTR